MSTEQRPTVTLMAGGDVGPRFEPTAKFAELIAPTLAQADLRFAQCERLYSTRGEDPQFIQGPGAHALSDRRENGGRLGCGRHQRRIHGEQPRNGLGTRAMLDSIAMFRKKGMYVVGAGKNADEARAPP